MKAVHTTAQVARWLIASLVLLQWGIDAHAQGSSLQRMLEMSEQLDRQDNQDFLALIDQADRCTRARDYACSERKLQSAKPLATSSKQRDRLQQAGQAIVAERAREAEEVRLAEVRRRREEEREAREQAMAEAAAQESSQSNTLAAFSAALGSVAPRTSLAQVWAKQNRDMAQLQRNTDRQREQERRQQQTASLNQPRTDSGGAQRAVDDEARRRKEADDRRAREEELQRQNQARKDALADEAQRQVGKVGSVTGRRIPAIQLVTVSCTNEAGSFSGEEKAPVNAQDCREEVLAHRRIQCRSDWMVHPATKAMNACFVSRGIADLSEWPRLQ